VPNPKFSLAFGFPALVLAQQFTAPLAPPASGTDRPAAASSAAGEPGGVPDPAEVIAVLDIAHASQFSAAMMQRTPAEAAQWLVNEHLSKGATMGVTLVVLRNPYRWRPEPKETNVFGGAYPERRAALHVAIAAAKAQGKPMPRLACYQTLPKGTSLSAADRAILDQQLAAFDEDEWEAIGCAEWQQDMIDERRLLRPQYLEPIWDRKYTRQWTYPIDVTELFMSIPRTPYQLYPDPVPEIRCSMHRPYETREGETSKEAFARNARKFLAFCIPKGYTPLLPLDLYTQAGVTASELYIVHCAGDYDGSGFVNGDDYDEFVNDFLAGSRLSDMDGNGFFNGDDFDLFMNAWIPGC